MGEVLVEAPQRPALKQQAYSQLKELTLSGELEAGTVLSVRQFATRLQISRTPVQSALERLEAEELVTLAPQQGVVIRVKSIDDIVNHCEIRLADRRHRRRAQGHRRSIDD